MTTFYGGMYNTNNFLRVLSYKLILVIADDWILKN